MVQTRGKTLNNGRMVLAALAVAIAVALLLVMAIRPAQGASAKAKTADSFVQSIGIDTHLKNLSTPYGDYAKVKAMLSELGVKHARDAAVIASNKTVYGRYADLHSTLGIRYTLNVNADLWPTAPNASQIDQMVAQAGGGIEMFEGPNEYNNHRDDTAWVRELEAYQKKVFEAINTSKNARIPLLAAPLGKEGGGYPPSGEIPDLGPYSDFNNMHSYPGGNHPTGGNPNDPAGFSLLFDRDMPMAAQVGIPGRDLYSTETGYTTAPGNMNEVSDLAKAKYTPRLSFEYFNAGVKRAYNYQLLDHLTGTTAQAHFGLVKLDGTKKPAFRAMENTIDILEDPGPDFVPSAFDYTLVNTTPDIHQTLLQKRDGTFYLVLWREVRSYDKQADRDISVPSQKVTVNFPTKMKTIRVFDPTIIASSGPTDDAESRPSRTLSSVNSVTEPIGDQVKIIQVTKP